MSWRSQARHTIEQVTGHKQETKSTSSYERYTMGVKSHCMAWVAALIRTIYGATIHIKINKKGSPKLRINDMS